MTSGSYQRFASPALDPGERFDYWRDWYSQAIDVPMHLEPLEGSSRAFEASAEALTIGDVDLVDYRFGPAVGSWTREGIISAERLRLVILAPSGGGSGSWHGRQLSLGDGAAALLGSTPGRWEARRGMRGIQVNVPRAAVDVTEAQLSQFNDQRRLGEDPVFAGLVRPALLGLMGRLDPLSTADAPELRAVWISFLTMLARSLAGQDTIGIDTAPARWLQVRNHIRANLADPRLSPATIAEALFVSRSTLYASLPPESDGIAAEIQRQRLTRAHALLRDPTNKQSIAKIGASVGLPDPSRFARVFRDRYGAPPREIRAGRPRREER
jgi:AraC-like DNA-binding protein